MTEIPIFDIMVQHYTLTLGPYPRGFHIITEDVFDAVAEWPETGMLYAFIRHTSAGLCINENADPDVLHDFKLYFDQLAPEMMEGCKHDMEGPDDMPAHIKSTLTGASIHIPIINGRAGLGQWQGIYLCEFRNQARKRDIIISIIS